MIAGQKYALTEVKVILSDILRKYKVVPPSSEYPDINLISDVILRSKTGVNVRLLNRKHEL